MFSPHFSLFSFSLKILLYINHSNSGDFKIMWLVEISG